MKGAKSLDVYTYFEFPATSCRINHHAPAVERGSYRVRPYTEALYSPVLPVIRPVSKTPVGPLHVQLSAWH